MTPSTDMPESLAQIVCVRVDGSDPRTVAEMDAVAEQLKKLSTLKDWPGKNRRPVLELWDDSGAKLDPNTGEALPRPEPVKAPPAPEKPAKKST